MKRVAQKPLNGQAYARYAEQAALAWGERYNKLTRLIETGQTAKAAAYARKHGLVYPRN